MFDTENKKLSRLACIVPEVRCRPLEEKVTNNLIELWPLHATTLIRPQKEPPGI